MPSEHNRHYAKFGIMAVDPRFLPPRQLIASEEPPRRQPITARLPTNHCPLFVQPPRKRPDKRTATDNLPEISMRSVHLSRQIGGHAPV